MNEEKCMKISSNFHLLITVDTPDLKKKKKFKTSLIDIKFLRIFCNKSCICPYSLSENARWCLNSTVGQFQGGTQRFTLMFLI
jgi:hypothetical protein